MKKLKTLKKNYEFKNVLNKGKFYTGKQIIVYINNNKSNENIIGIAVSSKVGKAVKRNQKESYKKINKRKLLLYKKRKIRIWTQYCFCLEQEN